MKTIFKSIASKQQSKPGDYMLLGRMIADVHYYKENGYNNRFYAGSLKAQLKLIEKQYNGLNPKPQWISKKQLNDILNNTK